MDKLSDGDVLYVRWLELIIGRYDKLHRTMKELMGMGVKLVCTLNGMEFDGITTDPMKKATRDAMLAFMAVQGEADYTYPRDMQARGIEIGKAKGIFKGPSTALAPATVKAWRAKNGKGIAATAEHFQISVSTVKRYCALG